MNKRLQLDQFESTSHIDMPPQEDSEIPSANTETQADIYATLGSDLEDEEY